jgi:hypothetical protein
MKTKYWLIGGTVVLVWIWYTGTLVCLPSSPAVNCGNSNAWRSPV